MDRLILIDGNNWGFAGMQSPKLSAGQIDTQAVLSVLKKVRNVFIDHPGAMVMVLWDGRSWRKDVDKEYKANRSRTDKQVQAVDAYKEQKKLINQSLRLLGVTQVSAKNMEADDLAYTLTKNAVAKGVPVTLLTADHDWMQLVQPGVVWVNVIHDQSCRHESFTQDTAKPKENLKGFKDSAQFVESKCVLGDTGDNVKGVHGIGPKTLERIYDMYPSFELFLNELEVFGFEAVGKAYKAFHGKVMPKVLRDLHLPAARKRLADARTMMDLATPNRPKPEELSSKRYPIDRDKFLIFCHKLAFNRIVNDFDKFIKPFEENTNVIRSTQ